MSRDHIHGGGPPPLPPPHQFTTTIIKNDTQAGACDETHWRVIAATKEMVRGATDRMTCSVCDMEHAGGWSREAGMTFAPGEWMTWHLEKWHSGEPGICFDVRNSQGRAPYP